MNIVVKTICTAACAAILLPCVCCGCGAHNIDAEYVCISTEVPSAEPYSAEPYSAEQYSAEQYSAEPYSFEGEPAPTPAVLLTVAPTQTATAAPTSEAQIYEIISKDVRYPSRGVLVPATVVIPKVTAGQQLPCVIMIHGHGGNRNQGKGFKIIAEALGAAGIASIRMDLSGCGDSYESFRENCLSNMRIDVQNAILYMQKRFAVDAEKIGMLGYSMGGKVELELMAMGTADIYAAAFIAPAADTNDLKRIFGGESAWQTLKAQAEQAGYAVFGTGRNAQELGIGFFIDLEKDINPSQAAGMACECPALVIYAENDAAVSPWVSLFVAEQLDASVFVVQRGGHSYGLSGKDAELLTSIINQLTAFFLNPSQYRAAG